MTLQVYAHVLPNMQTEAARLMSSAWSPFFLLWSSSLRQGLECPKITSYQRAFLLSAPTFQLPLTRDGRIDGRKGLRVDEINGKAYGGVVCSVTAPMVVETGTEIARVTNVESVVTASQNVDPRHPGRRCHRLECHFNP